MKETQLNSLITAFEQYFKLMAKIADSLPPAHDVEARAKAFDEIYVLSASMMDKIRHDLALIKGEELI